MNPHMPYPKRYVQVREKRMACVDHGTGDPVVFLHGNPTSSYLWRNVMPHLEGRARLVAPDLIGMGDSDKLPASADPARDYRFALHRSFLDALLDELGIRSNVTLVLHDWGSALGFDWARRHPDAVSGIAYMEAIVRPFESWDEWPEAVRPIFQGFRSPAGEAMILEQNVFVEQVLPGAILRTLDPLELDAYRAPFAEPGEARRPTLSWPRELPIAGEPQDVAKLVSEYAAWLTTTPIPKLFIDARPGAILRGEAREFCRSWPNQVEVSVPGIHFVQEDSPHEIGRALVSWLDSLTL